MKTQAPLMPLGAKLAYALPALALAVVGIPVYVYIPKFYTDVVGVEIAVVGYLLFGSSPHSGSRTDRGWPSAVFVIEMNHEGGGRQPALMQLDPPRPILPVLPVLREANREFSPSGPAHHEVPVVLDNVRSGNQRIVRSLIEQQSLTLTTAGPRHFDPPGARRPGNPGLRSSLAVPIFSPANDKKSIKSAFDLVKQYH